MIIKVTDSGDVPNGKHFAIIEFERVSVDTGWDESESRIISTYKVYDVENEFKERIRFLAITRTPFVALNAERIPVSLDVNIKL